MELKSKNNFWKSSLKYLILLIAAVINFSIRDDIEKGYVIPKLILVFAWGAIAAIVVYLILKNFKPVKYFTLFIYSSAIFFLIISINPEPTTIANSSELTYSHKCTWCGREYKGIGYMHVADQCIQPVKEIGIDITCSEKCCWESWKATH